MNNKNIRVGYQVLDLMVHNMCRCPWCRVQRLVYQAVNRKVFGRDFDDKFPVIEKKGICVKCGTKTVKKMYCSSCKKEILEKAYG